MGGYRPRVGRLSADMSVDISAESVDRQRSLLHMIQISYYNKMLKISQSNLQLISPYKL